MPEWLPDKASVDPWTENTYDVLYDIFCRDIRNYDLRYNGKSVWFFPEKEDGKEKIFWHLTSRESKSIKIPRRKRKFYPVGQTETRPERLPDLRRSERLPWVKPLIENFFKSEVLAWDYEEGDLTVKNYIWLKKFDFVVILKKYSNESRRLITSFYVDKPFKRNDFETKYKNRIK